MSRTALMFSFFLLVAFPCGWAFAGNKDSDERFEGFERELRDLREHFERELNTVKQENAQLRAELEQIRHRFKDDELTPAIEAKLAEWFETQRARSSLIRMKGEEGSFITGLRFTGQIRERFEYVDNLRDFRTGRDDETDFVDSRVRLGLALEFQDRVNALIELQHVGYFGDSSTEFGPNLRNDEDSEVQLYQAYIDFEKFFGTPVRFRCGRQEIVKGTQFLIGNADFDEGLTFDAVRFTHVFHGPGLEIDFWAARLSDNYVNALVTPGSPDDVRFDDDKRDFFGFYSTWTGVHEKANFIDALEFYVLFIHDQTGDLNDANAALTGRSPAFLRPIGMTANFSNDFVGEDRWTVGGRIYGSLIDDEVRRLSYNFEMAFQFGDAGHNGAFDMDTGEPVPGGGARKQGSIRALGIEANVRHRWKEAFLSPSLEFGYVYASGDDDPYDRTVNTFNPLFQNNHERLGYSDMFFAENIHAFSVIGRLHPFSKLEIGTGVHYFLAAADEDLGAPRAYAPLTGNLSHDAAFEFDLFVKYQYSRRVKFIINYSRVQPGKLVTANERALTGDGSRDSIDRAYFHVQFDF